MRDVAFEHSIFKSIKTMPGIKDKLVQPSYLQLELLAQSGKAQYSFALLQNNSNPAQRNSEIRLNQNDAFVALKVGLFLKSEDPAKPGQGLLTSYGSPAIFPTVSSYVLNQDVDALFNSNLSIKVGDTVFAQNIDMRPCRNVRTSQKVTAGTNQNGVAYDEQTGWDGLIDNEPIITFDGGKKNDVILTVPSYPGQLVQVQNGGTNGTASIYLVLKFWGFLVTNGSGIGQVNS